MRKILTVVAASVAMVLMSSLPAWAIVEKSGTIYCSGYATARAEYYGSVYLKGPGDSSYQYSYSPGKWAVTSNLGNPDGYWRAYVSGASGLTDSGTYAYCHSGG